MIELNCSYEESKKILELGYDFSSVCATFSASGKTSSHGLPFATMITNPFLKEVGHLKNLNHLKSLPYMRLDKEIDIDSIVPIIPKAALEACLPDLEEERSIVNARVWLGKDLYAVQEDCIYSLDSDGSGYGSYYLERLKDQGFKSAFEAFIWCHENYPEELRKKFEEIIK